MEGSGIPVPGAPVTQVPHRVANPNDPPRELSGLAWGAFVSLGLVAILAVLRLLMALKLHSALADEGNVTDAYHRYSTWVGIGLLAGLLSAGVFIAWFYRAYKNLGRLGVENQRYGKGWAIGSWFIPFFNWVRPKQMANDIWRGSERGVDTWWYWRQVEVSSLLHWWWALFLAQGIISYVGQQMTQSGYRDATTFGTFSHGLSQMKSGTAIDVVGQLIALGAVVLAINVVSQLTQRLDEIRAEALAGGSVNPYAVPTAGMTGYPPPVAPTPSYPPSPPAPAAGPTYPPPSPSAAPLTSMPPPAPPVAASPPQQPPAYTDQRIQCPECAEWIQAQANVCRYCGHRRDPAGQ
jgi:hypothetical protein